MLTLLDVESGMLRRMENPTSGKLSRYARRRGVTVEQLRAVIILVGWDPATLDAALARLRGHPSSINDDHA
jgi:hypothetical protein